LRATNAPEDLATTRIALAARLMWLLIESRIMNDREKRGMTLGMVVGNRGFFPDHLARSGHQEMKAALESAGVKVIALTEEDSKFGAVETRPEARRCADLFKKNR